MLRLRQHEVLGQMSPSSREIAARVETSGVAIIDPSPDLRQALG